MPFTFIDLFAGIGGFHAALSAAGGECVFASEIDDRARAVYERNWGDSMRVPHGRPLVEGDIVPLTEGDLVQVPPHDVLAAGFPCQPFSKSGHQRGINETRGTLFFNIARVLEARRPAVVLLENVRNLAGPRHRDTWATIVRTLRELGYRVAEEPLVFSPHLLPPGMGGTPQIRQRVFIVATQVGAARAMAQPGILPTLGVTGEAWTPSRWDLNSVLLDDTNIRNIEKHRLSDTETHWIDVWDELVRGLRAGFPNEPLPGFPLWADAWVTKVTLPDDCEPWRRAFLEKNAAFYEAHRALIDSWRDAHPEFSEFPASRRKLEWQAQETPSLWDTVMHLRPSGIRAKRATYLPALVAITQTSVIGPLRRRLTPREAARLQGLPDWFDFGDQPDASSFKQLGNAVAVGAAYHVFREHMLQDADVPANIRSAVQSSPARPMIPRDTAQAAGMEDGDGTKAINLALRGAPKWRKRSLTPAAP